MEFRQFIYTPIVENENSKPKVRSIYVINENDTYVEGYDISVVDDEDLKDIDKIKKTLEEAKSGEKFPKYALYFRRFLKSRIALYDLKELKNMTLL